MIQLGAIAVVLAVSTHRLFDLDRFLVPKELVLHATAVIAGLFALRAMRKVPVTRIGGGLLLFLLLSVIAAALATNVWLAMRAVAVTASAIVLFFAARALRDAGLARPLLNALALAVVLAAVTSLVQAYGVRLEIFATSRAPGGTLGNRNFVAHAMAFGFPVVLLAALRGSLPASIGAALVTATLVLTRSRAAWLAFAAMAVVILFGMLLAPALRRDKRTWARIAAMCLFIGGGVAAALLVPNALKWRSDNPYLESVRDVANYQEGSGRGRLIQYEQSLRMAAAHPVLGVGPGNWPVDYPAHAVRNDPSLDTSVGGMTFNPWPSSDWVAFVAERGFVAALLMMLVFAGLALSGLKQLRRALEVDDALLALTLVATVVAAGVVG
ncbi:MAG: O-antigen ligase family protein, partial [Thermoanaerobaculia bacterium]